MPLHSHSRYTRRKISFLIDELLETERNYINTLQKGIATYVEAVFNDQTPPPPELSGKKYHLFGNLEYIYRFHRNAFLPKLLTTGNDVERIADVFIHFLENDSFYGYILYSMYHPKSQRVCEQHISFFDRHQQTHGDKLGVKSLILQPIQRLPRYQLMLASIFKLLIKKPGAISRNTQLHKVCVAEKRLQTLIGIMNESVTINDILQCEKVSPASDLTEHSAPSRDSLVIVSIPSRPRMMRLNWASGSPSRPLYSKTKTTTTRCSSCIPRITSWLTAINRYVLNY